MIRSADVIVIGAGQAGLSAAYHLVRRGFHSADEAPNGSPTFIVLDADTGPGGAWQHRWLSLRMATVNNIYDLPGMPKPAFDPQIPAAELLPRYFGDFETEMRLPIRRPVHVRAVRYDDDDPHGRMRVETDSVSWSVRVVINATGTWSKPFWPRYPAQHDFTGRQLHTVDFVSADQFAGQHVAVVGGGISAVQFLDEISFVTSTSWFTRREPEWHEGFDTEYGIEVIAKVDARVRQGLPPLSVVAVTGLIWNDRMRAAAARGVLHRHPMFTSIEPSGVRHADGSFEPADVILWATGFRAALDHLAPLRLRTPAGGYTMNGTVVTGEPRLHLVGYGTGASTVGANRAGRAAVVEVKKFLALH